jgi:hypothetical protein
VTVLIHTAAGQFFCDGTPRGVVEILRDKAALAARHALTGTEAVVFRSHIIALTDWPEEPGAISSDGKVTSISSRLVRRPPEGA